MALFERPPAGLYIGRRGIPVDPAFTRDGLTVGRDVGRSMVAAMGRHRGLVATQNIDGRWLIRTPEGALVSGAFALTLGEAAGFLQSNWPLT